MFFAGTVTTANTASQFHDNLISLFVQLKQCLETSEQDQLEQQAASAAKIIDDIIKLQEYFWLRSEHTEFIHWTKDNSIEKNLLIDLRAIVYSDAWADKKWDDWKVKFFELG